MSRTFSLLFLLLIALFAAGGHDAAAAPAVYYEKISRSQTPGLNRHQVYRCSLATGQSAEIVSVIDDKAGEPLFILLPDESALIIDTPDRIDYFAITGRKRTKIYGSPAPARALLLSPDATQLLILDQVTGYEAKANSYKAVVYSFKTGKTTLAGKGSFTRGEGLGPDIWTDTGTVVFRQAVTDFSSDIWLYDVKTNRMTNLKKQSDPGEIISRRLTIARRGAYAAPETITICGPFGIYPQAYQTVDLKTGKSIGEFGIKNKQVRVVDFSPDGSHVLLGAADFPRSEEECGREYPETFYTSKIDGSNLQPVENLGSLFSSWKKAAPVSVKRRIDGSTANTDIIYGDKTVTTVQTPRNEYIRVIGASR